MRSQVWSYRWSLVLVATAVGTAIVVGAAAANLFAFSQLLVLGVLGAALAVAVYAWPPLGLLCGVTFPLLGSALGNSLIVPAGLLLVGVSAIRSWPHSSQSSRRAAGLILLLGVLTILIGIVLAGDAGPSQGRGVAVLFATTVGIAAAVGRQSFTFVGVCLCSAAVPMALIAYATPAQQVDRTTAVLGENANGVGVICALGFVAALTMVRSAPLGLRVLAFPVAFVSMAGVLVSGSRGALAVVLAGTLTALVWTSNARANGRRVVGLVVATGLVFLYAEQLFDRFSAFAGRSITAASSPLDGRLSLLPFALEQGADHPLRGVGLGQLGRVGMGVAGYRVDQRAHNVYIGAFAEMGIVVALLLVLVSALALRRAWTRARVAGLPLAVAVVTLGLSLEWWGSGVVGPVAMLVIGACLGLVPPVPTAKGPPRRLEPVGTDRVPTP